MSIPKPVYEQIQEWAQYKSTNMNIATISELLSTAPLSIDHIQPRSLGGTDDLNNLALACRRCNERRYNFVVGIDPEPQTETELFNPRRHVWSEHFTWTREGTHLIGKTAIGRATCERLDLNDEHRGNGFIQRARQQWKLGGLHPPADDSLWSEKFPEPRQIPYNIIDVTLRGRLHPPTLLL